uniref:Uncharacterized protein n=1 Tax=Pseudictyota dubia TaxID=2749911 RepID=A0A7R9WC61_9STRA|mmetsp:Transcript_42508/g.78614  ORF Transcript_42508/g.78614 Transcript_42508/m.78614 type:complete len:203 (+) Transcript_42508:70-678(+)|eukprot:CAMPEP_0197459238 /NCGR_PEP_ID=MMETSP1175-20131217/50875_1 /TAXON_ID=1003142 /ORGANISM="Triceratium dubium, Strain CCMP147" /LENGTH=202 /DNA_ID=CAMNT_0042994055 /DNA_START=62 /DNA_END=670 /DNA_ORIENTATION=+
MAQLPPHLFGRYASVEDLDDEWDPYGRGDDRPWENIEVTIEYGSVFSAVCRSGHSSMGGGATEISGRWEFRAAPPKEGKSDPPLTKRQKKKMAKKAGAESRDECPLPPSGEVVGSWGETSGYPRKFQGRHADLTGDAVHFTVQEESDTIAGDCGDGYETTRERPDLPTFVLYLTHIRDEGSGKSSPALLLNGDGGCIVLLKQ